MGAAALLRTRALRLGVRNSASVERAGDPEPSRSQSIRTQQDSGPKISASKETQQDTSPADLSARDLPGPTTLQTSESGEDPTGPRTRQTSQHRVTQPDPEPAELHRALDPLAKAGQARWLMFNTTCSLPAVIATPSETRGRRDWRSKPELVLTVKDRDNNTVRLY